MPFTALYKGESKPIWEFTDNDREENFTCKFCGSKMILVLGEKVSNHFRHWDSENINCGFGEGPEHLRMKKIISDLFKADGYDVSFEEIVTDELGTKNIIDVLITRGKRKIAIECQYSPISEHEVQSRTKSLNEKGFPVIWFLDAYSYPAITNGERRVKGPEKFLHRINYGKVYYLNRYKKSIVAAKFGKVKRYTEFKDVSYTRTLKTVKNIQVFDVDRLLFTIHWVEDILGSGRYWIARLMV